MFVEYIRPNGKRVESYFPVDNEAEYNAKMLQEFGVELSMEKIGDKNVALFASYVFDFAEGARDFKTDIIKDNSEFRKNVGKFINDTYKRFMKEKNNPTPVEYVDELDEAAF